MKLLKSLFVLALFAAPAGAADMMIIQRDIAVSAGGGAGDGCSVAGTTVNFRASANSTAATAANCTANLPTGTTTNDVMIGFLEYEKDAPSVTAPTGWTLIRSTMNPSSTPDQSLYSYYKVVAGTQAANFTWTHASGFRQCFIATYKDINVGCSAGPIDVTSVSTFSATANWSAASVTTTKTNDRSVIVQANFDGLNSNEPSGYTERVETSLVSIQDVNIAAIGATGNKDGSLSSAATAGCVIHQTLID